MIRTPISDFFVDLAWMIQFNNPKAQEAWKKATEAVGKKEVRVDLPKTTLLLIDKETNIVLTHQEQNLFRKTLKEVICGQ